jgi:hypothetical protein
VKPRTRISTISPRRTVKLTPRNAGTPSMPRTGGGVGDDGGETWWVVGEGGDGIVRAGPDRQGAHKTSALPDTWTHGMSCAHCVAPPPHRRPQMMRQRTRGPRVGLQAKPAPVGGREVQTNSSPRHTDLPPTIGSGRPPSCLRQAALPKRAPSPPAKPTANEKAPC